MRLAVSQASDEARLFRLEPLVAEYLLDLQVMGRSPRTLAWYREKLTGSWRTQRRPGWPT